MSRAVVWFSCGASSAVAAKYAVKKYKHCEVVYCDPGGEHISNKQFLKDCESWIGKKITILKSKKYKDHYDVFKKAKYLYGIQGSRCTLELKKKLRIKYQRPDDIHIFGYTLEEKARAKKFESFNPELYVDWILIDKQLAKKDCLGIIWQSNIKMPKLYDMGYDHNNCIGCIKGGMGYWNKIRKDFPEHFDKMAKIEREIGHTRFRDMETNERIWLDELDPKAGNFTEEPPISCDLSCGIAMSELTETIVT
tara:strand:- start:3538 stop:4290 length:753 start_codon:yes stop_codon:yes gene_type:complete